MKTCKKTQKFEKMKSWVPSHVVCEAGGRLRSVSLSRTPPAAPFSESAGPGAQETACFSIRFQAYPLFGSDKFV